VWMRAIGSTDLPSNVNFWLQHCKFVKSTYSFRPMDSSAETIDSKNATLIRWVVALAVGVFALILFASVQVFGLIQTLRCSATESGRVLEICGDLRNSRWISADGHKDILRRLAKQNVNDGNNVQAVALYDEIIGTGSQLAADYSNRGNAYYWTEFYILAAADYEHVLTMQPESYNALADLTATYEKLSQQQKISTAISKFILRNTESSEAYRLMAYYERHAKRLNSADYFAGLAVEKNDASAEAHNELALVNDTLGNNQFALSHYTKAVELEPSNSDYRLNRALLLAYVGETAAAIKDYQKLLDDNPDDPYYRSKLATVLIDRDELAPRSQKDTCRGR
jgi:tetratricopeptide (TPR) repeat protein